MIQPPRGMSIFEAYELYRKNKFIVNRRYQRKLVWTVKEKQDLIDSVLNKFPIPLILLAEDEEGRFEIIDGVQRLNAFFDFIENEFNIFLDKKERYFNVNDYTYAKSLADKGVFTPKQGQEIDNITQEQVSDFISYQFPITIYQTTENEKIKEIFQRINSHGKHLSPQEVRQAGVSNTFSNLVRELGSEIRGDVSKELLLLQEMPEISIESKTKTSGSHYGITAEETFWVKHGILNANMLRDSEDEQFIADIIISIVYDRPFAASKDRLDSYYGKGEKDLSQEIVVRINAFGSENLKKDIKTVYSTIVHFSDNYLDGNKLKSILNSEAGANPVKGDFYAVYMSFFDLMIKQNMEPFNFNDIARSLKDIHRSLTPGKKTVTLDDREKNIRICTGLIQQCFKKSTDVFRSSGSCVIDFQNYLMRSKVEAPNYDFKQGLYPLSEKNRVLSETTFEDKILHNIAAIANLGKNQTGYLFIGVTDKEADTVKAESLDHLGSVPRIHGFGIVGLEREAKVRGVTLDQYIAFIVDKISKSDLPKWLKTKLTKTITPITYLNNTVIMIKIEAGTEPVFYKEKLYIRDGASCKEVTGSAISAVFNLFTNGK